VGQQPNIHLGIEDLPRPEAHPAAPRRWKPRRPGELGSPGEVPWGGAFGTPGPDAGYAFVVLSHRSIPADDAAGPDDVRAALAELMVARASRFGRAPVAQDADVAELILGYRGEGLAADTLEHLADVRRRFLPGFAHAKHRGRALVAAVGAGALMEDPSAIRDRLAAGERLVG
jgi:hypothetical protein